MSGWGDRAKKPRRDEGRSQWRGGPPPPPPQYYPHHQQQRGYSHYYSRADGPHQDSSDYPHFHRQYRGNGDGPSSARDGSYGPLPPPQQGRHHHPPIMHQQQQQGRREGSSSYSRQGGGGGGNNSNQQHQRGATVQAAQRAPDDPGDHQEAERSSQGGGSSGKPAALVLKNWNDMTENEKIKELLPNEDLDFLPPPASARPSKEKTNAVVKELTRLVQEEIKKVKAKEREEAMKCDYTTYDSDDGEQSVDFGDVVVPVKTVVGEMSTYLPFIYALPKCPVLNLGFHAFVLIPGQDSWCYCPCGRHMATWRERFNLDGLLKENPADCCNSPKSFRPGPLMMHLAAKKDGGISETGTLHWIVEQYLKLLYKDYIKPGLHHKALYQEGTKEHKKALAAEMKELYDETNTLCKELEKYRKRNAELEEEVDELKKVNIDTAAKLKEKYALEEELRRKLQINSKPSQPQVFLPKQIDAYFERRDEVFQLFRSNLEYKRLLKKDSSAVSGITLRVPQECNIQALFESWSKAEEDTTHLFGELNDLSCVKWLIPWNVKFKAIIVDKKTKKVPKGMTAKDEGGPTRAFLNELWRQLPELNVASENKNVPLFFKGHNGDIYPVDDAIICDGLKIEDREKAQALVQPFYRAIGRILLHCLFLHKAPIESEDASETQHRFYLIGSHVMPNIYRNYLLRGIDPTDDRYNISDLVHDAVALLLLNAKGEVHDNKYFMKFLLAACDDDNDDDDVENVADGDKLQRRFRKFIKKTLIDGRSMALEALQMGLTLDGRLNLPISFQHMSLKAIDQMFFAKQYGVKADDAISVLRVDHCECEDLDLLATQHLILDDSVIPPAGRLPELLRILEEEDADFPSKFVEFATGCSYLPHLATNPDFQIVIEFNPGEETKKKNAFPCSHSCVNTVKLPATAYDGNMETLREKLRFSVEYCSKYCKFNMK